MKICKKIKCYSCGEIKHKSEFNILLSIPRGRQYWCLDCRDIVKEKRRIRESYKIIVDPLSKPMGKPCSNKCGSFALSTGNKPRMCATCLAISIKKYQTKSKERVNSTRDNTRDIYNELILTPGTKLCKNKECNTEKPYSDFYINFESKDHLGFWCKDCVKDTRSKHYQDNKDTYRTRHRAWKKENRVSIKRRHKEAKVAWGDTTAIRLLYKEMRRLNKEAGYVKYHVDHIIPMHHPLVCGLHVETNLQIILATANEHKGNSFTPGVQPY